MYAASGSLTVCKGYMKFKMFHVAYCAALREHPEANFVLHFRIATSGSINPMMCHPFNINPHLAMVHNGILLMELPENSPRSDTAIFVDSLATILPDGNIPDAYLPLLDAYAEVNASKFVFLNSDGHATISNEGDGIWDEGVWYSNRGYRPLRITPQYTGKGRSLFSSVNSDDPDMLVERDWQCRYADGDTNMDEDEDEDEEECSLCGLIFARCELITIGRGRYCPDCGSVVPPEEEI
jgi:hypothetical protein